MPITTVEAIYDSVRAMLADTQVTGGEVFTNTLMAPFFAIAYRRLIDEFLNWDIPTVEKIVYYTLPANTLTLTPATAGISDFGELVFGGLAELIPSGQFSSLEEVERLPERQQGEQLLQFVWRQDSFQFIGSTNSIPLRITYNASGTVPPSGSVGIDNADNFLITYTAALVAPVRDRVSEGQRFMMLALGPDGTGRQTGFLFDLIQPMLKGEQRAISRRPRYRQRRTAQWYW